MWECCVCLLNEVTGGALCSDRRWQGSGRFLWQPGQLTYPYIGKIAGGDQRKISRISTIHLYAIRNDFFGERITVSGLITGQDLTGQLKGQPLGERLLLPCNMLKIGEPVFLDDFTLEEVENSLQVKTDIVKSSGQDLLDAVIGVYENDDFSTDRRRGRFQEM